MTKTTTELAWKTITPNTFIAQFLDTKFKVQKKGNKKPTVYINNMISCFSKDIMEGMHLCEELVDRMSERTFRK